MTYDMLRITYYMVRPKVEWCELTLSSGSVLLRIAAKIGKGGLDGTRNGETPYANRTNAHFDPTVVVVSTLPIMGRLNLEILTCHVAKRKRGRLNCSCYAGVSPPGRSEEGARDGTRAPLPPN